MARTMLTLLSDVNSIPGALEYWEAASGCLAGVSTCRTEVMLAVCSSLADLDACIASGVSGLQKMPVKYRSEASAQLPAYMRNATGLLNLTFWLVSDDTQSTALHAIGALLDAPGQRAATLVDLGGCDRFRTDGCGVFAVGWHSWVRV
eukprot:TRINITY_DN14887_c0_g1_i1.p1 TRINITY_DN14887_c0_g1~~TRINITY_DN14887_c0_g1_i1.p1  ORF type:complete len:148 (+),score=15.11 TRINITY_DN14887_c0_g1_i1:174-617(+)